MIQEKAEKVLKIGIDLAKRYNAILYIVEFIEETVLRNSDMLPYARSYRDKGKG